MREEARNETVALLKFHRINEGFITFAGCRKTHEQTNTHQFIVGNCVATLIASGTRKIDKRFNLIFERSKFRVEIFGYVYISKL